MSKDNEIIWEDPGKSSTGNKYDWFYEALKENPGRWARYPGSGSSARSYAKNHEDFEQTTRGPLGNQIQYMRYVPKQPNVTWATDSGSY